MYTSTCQWVNLNRLGVAVKEDFGRLLFLYDYSIIAQLDTGLIAEDNTDMVLNVVACSLQSIEIETDMEYKTKPKSELAGKYPRRNLWDNYSLSINHQEYKADNWGNMLQGNSICPLVCEESKEYIDFTITKYKGFFTGEKLLRDIDNEEVFIESSAGLCIPTRVRLKNGVGTFRIYPFGYKGFVKVKLGHKWYKVWNDYSFNFG